LAAAASLLSFSNAAPALADQALPKLPSQSSSTAFVNLPPVTEFGRAAANKGVTFIGGYIGQFASNVVGGAQQGGKAFDYQVYGGVNIDLGTMFGLQGGSLQAVMSERSGYNLAQKSINNSVSVQSDWGGNETYHLMILTYKQKLLNDALEVTLGRISSNFSIIPDKVNAYFLSNAVSGGPFYFAFNSNITSTQVPSWAASVSGRIANDLHYAEWLFDSIPEQQLPAHHGFDFSFADSVGAISVTRLDYSTSFLDDSYPRHYGVGVVIDRTPYTYLLYDSATHRLGSGSGYGRSDILLFGRQAIYRPDTTSKRNVSVFAQFMYGPNPHQTLAYQIIGGVVDQGPFASRPLDRIDLMVENLHYRDRYINQLYAYRVNVLGGKQRPSNNMIMGEINYDFYPAPWLDIMPNFQYIVNTDGLGFGLSHYPKNNIRNTYVIGLQFQVDWAAVLGLPESL
jgi:porin